MENLAPDLHARARLDESMKSLVSSRVGNARREESFILYRLERRPGTRFRTSERGVPVPKKGSPIIHTLHSPHSRDAQSLSVRRERERERANQPASLYTREDSNAQRVFPHTRSRRGTSKKETLSLSLSLALSLSPWRQSRPSGTVDRVSEMQRDLGSEIERMPSELERMRARRERRLQRLVLDRALERVPAAVSA